MKMFCFVLYVLNASGNYSAFVIDYNLTETDCSALLAQWGDTLDQFSKVECQ